MTEPPLPPYAFVPGGPWPHPLSSPHGHLSEGEHEPIRPIVGDAWRECPAYLRGFQLFNAGYYWEAHEAWEGLWHAHERNGPIADLLKALIKLAAAGVKIRQGQPRGVAKHAGRAAGLLEGLVSEGFAHHLGLDLQRLARFARRVEDSPPGAVDSSEPLVVFDVRLEPGS